MLRSFFSPPTHTCGALSAFDIGKNVLLCGWLQKIRWRFAILKDTHGSTQLFLNQPNILKNVPLHSFIAVNGTVQLRPKSAQTTGEIDVLVDTITVLNPAIPLPFDPNDDRNLASPLFTSSSPSQSSLGK